MSIDHTLKSRRHDEIPEEVRRIALGRIDLGMLAKNREECESALDFAFSWKPETAISRKSPITVLGLDQRLVNHLEAIGVERVGQLCSMSRSELMDFEWFGPYVVNKIEASLAECGMKLRQSFS